MTGLISNWKRVENKFKFCRWVLGIKRFYVSFKKVITRSRRLFKMHLRASSLFSKAKALRNNFNTAVPKKKKSLNNKNQASKLQTNKKISKQTGKETKRKLTGKGKKLRSKIDLIVLYINNISPQAFLNLILDHTTFVTTEKLLIARKNCVHIYYWSNKGSEFEKYCWSFLFGGLWTEPQARSINSQKIFPPCGPNKLVQ